MKKFFIFIFHFLFNERHRDIFINYHFPNLEFFRDRLKYYKERPLK